MAVIITKVIAIVFHEVVDGFSCGSIQKVVE